MASFFTGEPVETRLDPNLPVDHLTPPPPSTIKLRMRRKSAVKWSLPVVVDERINRTRWIIVDSDMKVEDVVKVLRTVEGKEDVEGWGLWVEGVSFCCSTSLLVCLTVFFPQRTQSHALWMKQKNPSCLGIAPPDIISEEPYVLAGIIAFCGEWEMLTSPSA